MSDNKQLRKACCDNGYFGEAHDCQKQPGEPPRKARMYLNGLWILDAPVRGQRYHTLRRYALSGLAMLAKLPELLPIPDTQPINSSTPNQTPTQATVSDDAEK